MFDCLLEYVVKNFIDKNDKNILFVCSDHGFNSLHKLVYVNNWLECLGLFVYKKSRRVKNKIIKAEDIQRILMKIGLKGLMRHLKKNIFRFKPLLKIIPSETIGYIHKVDWEKTKAYFSEATFGIHVNIHNSSMTETERIRIENLIINEAYKLIDHITGENVIKRTYKRKELYFGPYAKDAPDIVFLKKEGYRFVGGYNENENIFEKSQKETGDHNENGILIVYGNDIKKGHVIKNATVYDITPTILYILRLPIPSYMDGHILMDLFKEKSILAEEQEYHHTGDIKEKIQRKIKRLKLYGKI